MPIRIVSQGTAGAIGLNQTLRRMLALPAKISRLAGRGREAAMGPLGCLQGCGLSSPRADFETLPEYRDAAPQGEACLPLLPGASVETHERWQGH